MVAETALVTGGAGFIGSHMVDLLLAKDFNVRVIDNVTGGAFHNLAHHKSEPRLSVEEIDIRNIEPDISLFNDVKYVFHFAGKGDIVPSIEEPSDYLSCNVMGTVKVLEASRNSNVEKFVYAASSSCYGVADELPTSENAKLDPRYPYALSKLMGEQATLHWNMVYGLPVISLRIFNAYGPRSRTTGVYGAVFGVFLAQKLAGKPYTVVGDGEQSRDFVFASDVANAFLKAAESGRQNEIYNLGGGRPQTINTLVKLLGGSVIYIPKRPGEPDCTWADTRKVQSDLLWQPQVSFEEGVSVMLENIDYWRDAPLWDPHTIERATESWFEVLGSSNNS